MHVDVAKKESEIAALRQVTRTEKDILAEVRALAVEYHQLAGKPLGVTGEIGEFEAAEKLGLNLAGARTVGYDATDGDGRRIQIKSRWKRDGANWGRVSRIDVSKEFDSVMLVLMRGNYEVHEIWEAKRHDVIERLSEPGSKARNERGQLGVSQFMSIARKVWPLSDDGYMFSQDDKSSGKSSGKKVCPECGHVFWGNGWVGIDAHWRSKHEQVMPYEKAWPLLSSGTYVGSASS